MGGRRAVEDLVFDVGLHRGEDSAFYLAMGYRVVGFEADPQLAAHCRERFAGEIAGGRFTLVEGAITSAPGDVVTFYRHDAISVWGTTEEAWVDRNRALGCSTALQVPAVDFRHWLSQAGVPHYMKVDIEGADRVCFEALRDLAERPRYVSLESTKTGFDALVAEFDLLEELGYTRFALVQQAGMESRSVSTTGRHGEAVDYRFEPDSSGPFGTDVGPWISREAAIAEYRRIFRRYRWLGDRSFVHRHRVTRRLRDAWAGVRGTALPGWYDTHAMRA